MLQIVFMVEIYFLTQWLKSHYTNITLMLHLGRCFENFLTPIYKLIEQFAPLG